MRRGDIYRYSPVLSRPGQSLLRLIISADSINNSPLPVVLAVQVRDRDPASLLAPRVGEFGWADVMTIEVAIRRRLISKVGEATADEMDAIDAALRAAQDL